VALGNTRAPFCAQDPRRNRACGAAWHRENVNQNPTGVLDYGIEVSEARRLKSLEDENRRLRKLLAEAMLDNAALKDLLGKNG
jgi:hypothetical protein